MRDIFITADDYGLDPAVNGAIDALARRGAITSASVMCHDGAELRGVQSLASTGVAVGAHLVLVEERPLAPGALAPLLERDGRLPASWPRLFARLAARPWLCKLLAAEAAAQLARFDSLGVPLSFLNSHQHVHLFPPLWHALQPIFASRPHAAVRVASRWRPRSFKEALLTGASALSWRWRPLPARRLLFPLGVAQAGRLSAPALDGLCAAAAALAPGELPELVVHPGSEDQGLRARYRHWGYGWQAEFHLLASDALPRALERHGLRKALWK